MNKKNIRIKFLSYLYRNNGEYIDVEAKSVIIKHFTGVDDIVQRLEMKKFLDFLRDDDLINITSLNGIGFVTDDGGKYIPKKDISIKARITPKGLGAIMENDKYQKNNITFYLSFLFGLSTFLLGWNAYFDNQSIKSLKDENAQLKENYTRVSNENAHLKDLKVQNDFPNKDVTGKKNLKLKQ